MRLRNIAVITMGLFLTGVAHAVPITTTLTNLDEQFLGTGGLAVFGTFEFEITNATAFVWTDFHFFDAEPIGNTPIGSYVGPGSISLDAIFQFDIVGLNIGIGEVLIFEIDHVCGIAEVCSLGGAIWQGFATIDGANSVPEPGTLALLGLGIVAMGLARRRKKV